MIKRILQPAAIFIVLIIIVIPVILPYFHPGFFPTHDGEWAVVRLADMFRSLRDQQFPVRYSGNLNFGFGYPLFNFAYPAPYYLGVLLHFIKIGFVDSIKFLFAVSVIFSAFTMYLFSLKLWNSKIAAVLSAVFYIYFPYRIVDLYARGSIGESISFILFPLILLSVLKIIDDRHPRLYISLGALSYALLVMTHNIMAVLFTPILFIFIIFKLFHQKRKRYLYIIIFILLSYGLSAFFWLPALLEKHNILLSQIPIADRDIYFVTINQLLIPKWGYGLPDHPDGFSYQLGLSQIGILLTFIILSVISWFKRKKFKNHLNFQTAFLLGITSVILIILMFSFTKIIWQITPLLKEINYPWTLLAPLGFIISLLAGYLWLQNKFIKILLLILIIISFIYIIPNAKPESFFDKGDQYYLTNDATTTSSRELMPLWVKIMPVERANNKVLVLNGSGTIQNINSNSKLINFDADLKKNSVVRINTIYYPGWEVAVDGKIVPIKYNNSFGVMDISLLPGVHKIKANFSETPLRLIADIISIVSIILLAILTGFIPPWFKNTNKV